MFWNLDSKVIKIVVGSIASRDLSRQFKMYRLTFVVLIFWMRFMWLGDPFLIDWILRYFMFDIQCSTKFIISFNTFLNKWKIPSAKAFAHLELLKTFRPNLSVTCNLQVGRQVQSVNMVQYFSKRIHLEQQQHNMGNLL